MMLIVTPPRRAIVVASCVALLAPIACNTLRSGTKCEENLTCPNSGAGAAGEAGAAASTGGSGHGTTTTTGHGGIGGIGNVGGSGGTGAASPTGSGGPDAGGAGGISASASGNTGTGGDGSGGSGSSPCDNACGGATPLCDTETATCVECLATSDCDAGVCDPDTQRCVECLETTDCETGVCDPAAHFCVDCLDSDDCQAPTGHCATDEQVCAECLDNTHCAEPAASWCDDNSCAPCQTNTDCAHLTGTTVCDLPTGECVECTGTDYASCGVNVDDQPLVCDSLTRTCTDQVEHGAGLCVPCVSDAHCALGELCVMQVFNDEEVGHFCFWREGDTEQGAPETCGSASRPYFDQVPNITSIDQQVANICTLDVSTCVARNQFRSKPCGTTVPDDSLCGVAPPADALCAEASATEHFCTMTCGNDFDCPLGFPCIDDVGTPYCEL